MWNIQWKERKKERKKATSNSRYAYQYKLDKAFFKDGIAHRDCKNLARRKLLIKLLVNNLILQIDQRISKRTCVNSLQIF